MTDDAARHLEALPDDEPAGSDFAEEHQDSVADKIGGGPEHTDEPESPQGRAGMD